MKIKNHLYAAFGTIAALAAVSCSNEFDGDFTEQARQENLAAIKAEYSQNFKERYGEPDPNHTWGFGPAGVVSRVTRGVNANANQWFTGEGGATPVYEVDPNVTEAERNAVFAYVNQDKGNLKVVSQPNWTDYFVTQVWKGDKNELNGQTTPQSTSYPNQNGTTTTVDGAATMDQLETQLADGTWEHIYNFNNANNGNSVTDVNGNVIVEKMLMVNSGTCAFRYNNSQGSFQSQKYIVLKGSDIPNMPAECADYYYVCFDFEKGYTDEEKAAEETKIYSIYGSYTYTENSSEGGESIPISIKNLNIDWTGGELNADNLIEFLDNSENLWRNGGDTPYGWNNQGGTVTSVSNLVSKEIEDKGWAVVYEISCDITYVIGGNSSPTTTTVPINGDNLTVSGYYPQAEITSAKVGELYAATNLSDKNITNINITSYGSMGYLYGQQHFDGDNYYTDWIVRISPAIVKGDPTPTPDPTPVILPTGAVTMRIMCEDLGNTCDFDFNDVVFDATWDPSDKSHVKVVLRAAGGTLPIFVGGHDVKQAFNVESNVPVNVSAGADGLTAWNYNGGSEVFTVDLDQSYDSPYEAFKNIPVTVVSQNEERGAYNLNAHNNYNNGVRGGDNTPVMICVPTTVRWTKEYIQIESAYPEFKNWVTNMNHMVDTYKPWYHETLVRDGNLLYGNVTDPHAYDLRLPLTGGSSAGSEMQIAVGTIDYTGKPLSATYAISNATWGDNASHLSLFKYKPLPASVLNGYSKVVVEFGAQLPSSNGDATYGFIPCGFVNPAPGMTNLGGMSRYEVAITDEMKQKGIEDYSIFFNANGDLKEATVTIKGVWLVR